MSFAKDYLMQVGKLVEKPCIGYQSLQQMPSLWQGKALTAKREGFLFKGNTVLENKATNQHEHEESEV